MKSAQLNTCCMFINCTQLRCTLVGAILHLQANSHKRESVGMRDSRVHLNERPGEAKFIRLSQHVPLWSLASWREIESRFHAKTSKTAKAAKKNPGLQLVAAFHHVSSGSGNLLKNNISDSRGYRFISTGCNLFTPASILRNIFGGV